MQNAIRPRVGCHLPHLPPPFFKEARLPFLVALNTKPAVRWASFKILHTGASQNIFAGERDVNRTPLIWALWKYLHFIYLFIFRSKFYSVEELPDLNDPLETFLNKRHIKRWFPGGRRGRAQFPTVCLKDAWACCMCV